MIIISFYRIYYNKYADNKNFFFDLYEKKKCIIHNLIDNI